ncbi:MAG: SgcJ/EcaC family oxidoreductase [Actinomycetota bacterium]
MTDDQSMIRAVIKDIETGLNVNDASLMTRHFRRDATVVGANGVLLEGLDAIRDAHEVGLKGFLKDEHVSYEVDGILLVRPDVAVARKVARSADASGVPTESDPSMIATYVLVKDDGHWTIVARQNTLIS